MGTDEVVRLRSLLRETEAERDREASQADTWHKGWKVQSARVERLEAALRALCEKAELYLDEPEPTVLTPNPEHGKAGGALWKAVDVAREALAPHSPGEPQPSEIERRLRASLERFGRHDDACPSASAPFTGCTCGLHAALAGSPDLDVEAKAIVRDRLEAALAAVAEVDDDFCTDLAASIVAALPLLPSPEQEGRVWKRHWCEGCGGLLDRDDVDIDCRCANCGQQTEHVEVAEVVPGARREVEDESEAPR